MKYQIIFFEKNRIVEYILEEIEGLGDLTTESIIIEIPLEDISARCRYPEIAILYRINEILNEFKIHYSDVISDIEFHGYTFLIEV